MESSERRVYKVRLETKRLILRRPMKKDIKDLIKNINNLKVSRYLLVVPYPYAVKDAEWWVNECKKKDYQFSIFLKSTKKLIGGAGLSNIKKNTAEIGYWLGVKHHRKGFCSEAVKKVIDITFKKLNLNTITAPIFKENKPSQEFAKSLGFKYKGVIGTVKAKSTGRSHKELLYVLSRKDWK